MSEKVDISKLNQLIADAQAASAELEDKKNIESKAHTNVMNAKDRAMKAWDAIYHHLYEIRLEHRNDEGFKSSKLYSLINAEKANKGVIHE